MEMFQGLDHTTSLLTQHAVNSSYSYSLISHMIAPLLSGIVGQTSDSAWGGGGGGGLTDAPNRLFTKWVRLWLSLSIFSSVRFALFKVLQTWL